VQSQEFTERGMKWGPGPWVGWEESQGGWTGTLRVGRVLRALTLPQEKRVQKDGNKQSASLIPDLQKMNNVLKGGV